MPQQTEEAEMLLNTITIKENNLKLKNTYSDHGNEMEEIISKRPPFMVRWGTVFFLVMLLLVALICWFIRYPDIVATSAKLTSINAPKEVKTKVDGKLLSITATEGLQVSEGQLLGLMESRAKADEVLALSLIIDTLQKYINNNKIEYLPAFLGQPFQHLGEVQQYYQTFMQGFILFKQYLSAGYYLKKKSMLQDDIGYMQSLHTNLLELKEIEQEDLGLADSSLKMNKKLIDEKAIADVDYRNERSKYLSKAMTMPQISATITTNESGQHEKQKEILQLENEIAQQKGIFAQALNTLKAQLDEWKNKYMLVAPIAGKVAFANLLQENQQLQLGQTICFINPENSSYFAQVIIPQSNFGKVALGQNVLLKFPAYPSTEYGAVKGKVAFISHIPTDSGGYLAKIILPEGLETNYKKQIQFRDGLVAQAEIITKDMRLLQRFYYSIAQQVRR